MAKITNITATKILDSRSEWTLCTQVSLKDGISGTGEVPSGISTGKHEAALLPVKQAIENVNGEIASKLKGFEVENQEEIDQILIELDGTENKSRLGANAVLSVSLAACDAAAKSQDLPLYKYISSVYRIPHTEFRLPIPMLLMFEGGKHATNKLDFQEFMITPNVGDTFYKNIEAGDKVYDTLKELLEQKSYSSAVGTEGGFSPQNVRVPEAFQLLDEAITKAAIEKTGIALDVAANSFIQGNLYKLQGMERTLNSNQLLTFYEDLVTAHPRLTSLEDPFAEEQDESWKKIKNKFTDKVEIIGDDILTTNTKNLEKAIEKDIVTGVIVKPNQVGTLTETIAFVNLAKKSKLSIVVSHRGGETNSSFIADLAVAIEAKYIKTGAPARGERVAKYNRLLEIEREIK